MSTDKVYHIYAKGQCIYHNLSEEEFTQIWDMLTKFIAITDSLKLEELEYAELKVEKCFLTPSY